MVDQAQLLYRRVRAGVGTMGIAILLAAASADRPRAWADSTSTTGPAATTTAETMRRADAESNARPRPVDPPESVPESSAAIESSDSKAEKAKNGAKDVAKVEQDDDSKQADEKQNDEKQNDEKQNDEKKNDEKKNNGQSTPARPIPREAEGFDLLTGVAFETDPSPNLTAVFRAIRTAQVHIRLGVAEHGNVSAFEAARRQLELATTQLSLTKGDSATSAKQLVISLKREVDGLHRVASTTFFGRFPLVRAFGLEMEDNEEFEVRSYAMSGDAQRKAVREALTQIGKSASAGPEHVLVLVPGVSRESRQTSKFAEVADAEAPGAFATVANLKLYPGELRTEVDPMPIWTAPDSAFDPICREFLKRTKYDETPRSVMLVLLREFTDENGDGRWVQAQQRTFEASSLEKAADSPEKLEADKVRLGEALAHDRSRFRLAILLGGSALFLASLCVHGGLSRTCGIPSEGWQRWLAIPTAGFVIGVVLPPLIMLAFQEWLPDPKTAALSAAWWPCTAGALTLILPAGVFRLGAGGAGRYFPSLSCHGRWGVAFVPVALGVCAAWIRPTCYALGTSSGPLIIALGIAATVLVYIFGRAVDPADQFPVALAPLALVLALAFGAGAFLGSSVVVGGVAGVAALLTGLALIVNKRGATLSPQGDETQPGSAESGSRRPHTIEQLRSALQAPRYQPRSEFEQLRKSITRSWGTHSTWIGLIGPSAAGKTAAARHLIGELQSSGEDVQVLIGRCAEEATPYQPFREALADLGVSASLLAARSQGGEVNNLFERLADEFIPFWDFFSSSSDDGDEEGSRSDLFAAVANTLYALTQKQRVVLFLDDVQWIDDGSAAILKHLHETFGPGGEARLLVILASRIPEALERLGVKESVIVLTPPSAAEQLRILESSLGIETGSARHIVSALGVMSQEAGGMFWVLRAVRELVAENAFSVTSRGFALRPAFLSRGKLPVPAAMRAKLMESLRASGQYLPVLECAALLGEKFRVDDLAECLEMDRLKLLQILRHLEQELQLVRDLPADQECYAFSSTFMLEIVKEELGAGSVHGKSRTHPSKIARELHARIAGVLERRVPRTPQLTSAIAQHYCEAGSAHAARCLEYSLSAARDARRKHNLDEARHFLTMARHSARLARRPIDFTEEWATIDDDAEPPGKSEEIKHLPA